MIYVPNLCKHVHTPVMSYLPLYKNCATRTSCIRKVRKLKYLVICISVTFLVGCFLSLKLDSDNCRCEKDYLPQRSEFRKILASDKDQTVSAHKLAVLVPFRNRFEELLEFIPHIHRFLNRQNINHHIYVLNQVDEYRFNRASLFNVGFREARHECDYIAMHDVDLLPLNPKLPYSYPESGPFHVSSPNLHPRYHYSTFVGGILLMKNEHFEAVNGMSNKYWGWGLEDDEFYVRLKEASLNISRPVNILTGRQNTFRHIHSSIRKRDSAKCFNQREVTRKRDRETGLSNVAYHLSGRREITIDGATASILNIALICDKQLTPWCDCIDAAGKTTSTTLKSPETSKPTNEIPPKNKDKNQIKALR